MPESTAPPLAQHLLVLNSREAILGVAPLLEAFAARCGQPGAMHWLPYFLDEAKLKRRAPRLVLLLGPEQSQARSLCVDDLLAAALFFEYQVAGMRTGIVATADAVGFTSVIAPAGQRAEFAALAARALLDRGAAVTVATFADRTSPASWAAMQPPGPGVLWATRTRRVARMLPLHPTLDETLAQMGKTTRFNLRYYRRRLEKQRGCEFVADAAPLLREDELQAINAAALNPVPAAEFARRVACASQLPGSFLCGLRAPDGRWLSLVGGWRQAQTTVLYWQTNTSGMEKDSLGTVMRSYFLEAEIGRGARSLLIFGGTPHSMRHAFSQDAVSDLVAERRGLRRVAIRLGARLAMGTGLLPRGNFVAETLCSAQLERLPAASRASAGSGFELKPVGVQRAA